MLEVIFSNDQSGMSLLEDFLSDWSIYLTVLHMIGWSKMNEIFPDVTPSVLLFMLEDHLNK